MFGLLRRLKRKAPRGSPFPPEWQRQLEDNVLLYKRLPEADQAKLRERLRAFIAAKDWQGCHGLALTDEMRVTVASLACLLSLGWDDFHFDKLHTLLLYPGGFLTPVSGEDSEDVESELGE